MMEGYNYQEILNRVKEEAKIAPPGLLQKGKTMESLIGHTVINLSDETLSKAQVGALEKGLTFCPTPGPPNKAQIWLDFKEFHRRLSLKYHFYYDNKHLQDLNEDELAIVDFMAMNLEESEDPYKDIHKKFVDKSSWKPPRIHQSLEVFQRAFKDGLLKSRLKNKGQPNLTKEQWTGLKELSSNPKIIIKKADKGSAVVVMNTTDYLREGYRQLNDTNFYTKLDHDPTQSIGQKITDTLIKMYNKGLISEKNLEHLTPKSCTEAKFYMLPKIHKKNVPGRPICSSVNHPTSRISKFVDEHIKQYVPHTKSHIRDTQDFIKKLRNLGQIPEGAILCTLDVSSLYTNIPNHEGILAVANKLRSDPTKTPITQFILDLLTLVLHNMNFEFNGEHYQQIGGTAMGTSLAPNYANLFMDRFETRALDGYPLKPLVWKRFIDDIFMVWTHGEESLNHFIEYLNSLHESIKFTHEFSYSEINFLDTTVKFNEHRELITTLYNKPTDTHLYLEYSSAHPSTVLEKGPFGQYLRLRRICTLDKDFKTNAFKLTGYYLKRGYPASSLKKHFNRANQFKQSDLLEDNPRETIDTPVMVTQFNPRNPPIKSLIRDNWNIIQNTDELKQIFKDKPLIGYKRLPNLKDLLTRSAITFPPTNETKQKIAFNTVCTRLGKCTYCPKLTKVDQITSFHTKKTFKCINLPPRHRYTCELSNVIYIINCTECGLQYIGETKRPIRQRMYEHYRSVQKFNDLNSTPVSRHFTQPKHSVRNMEFSIVQWMGEENNPDSSTKRKRQELFYIWAFPTLHPTGINIFV